MGIHVDDSRAYLAVGNADGYERPGIYIFNISNLDSPELIGYGNTQNAWDVWTKDYYAFVADMSEGLTVLDLSVPSSPKKIANTKWEENSMAEIIRGEGDNVYIAAGKHGLIIVDIKDPYNPQVKGKFKSEHNGFAEGLCVRNEIVFLANAHDFLSSENGLFVIDATELQNPQLMKKCTFQDWVEGVCLADNFLFITNTYSGVRSIDVRERDNPQLIDSYGAVQIKISIGERIFLTIEEEGIERALTLYEDLREKARDEYDFGEEELNQLGYYLLKIKKIDEAIEIFKLNQKVYPKSSNVYDSLGDAYIYRAITFYRKSLELNPKNKHAKEMILRTMQGRK